MIEVSSGQAAVGGAMTLATAKTLLDEGAAALATAEAFDLAGVTEVDSSGLAVLFGWMREAQRLNKTVRVVNLPESLSSLAQVYGVSDLLPPA